MLSWVREKLAEGRLRWQQSVVQQPQRNCTPSPPPLPPPSAIEDSPSATTPDHPHHSFNFTDDSVDTLQSPTATPTPIQRSSNGINQSHPQLQRQDNQIDTIKTATTSNLKRYSHISRISQRYDNGFYPSQYEPVWSSTPNSNFHTPTSIVTISRRPNDPVQPYVNLRIFNCIGSKCTIYAPVSLTFADVKRKVVAEFHARRQLFATPSHQHQTKSATAMSRSRERIEEQQQKLSCDNLDLVQLSRHYKLARISRLHEHFDEQCSLAAANVQNYEEMLLVLCTSATATYLNAHSKDVNSYANATTPVTLAKTTTNSISTAEQSTPPAAATATTTPSPLSGSSSTNVHKYYFDCGNSGSDSDDIETSTATMMANGHTLVPTQRDIDLATECEAVKIASEPNVVNIDELVLQSDVQYDIRKILISLANSCAYVIGSGPYATRIISMLKQRLVQRKQHEQDTQQCLIEMGFSWPKVQHALNINNNVYAAALEWLIENQSPTNPLFSEEQSSSMSLSSKFTNNTTVKDNIESLLEIIRIYCQRDRPPPPEMVQFIVGMGFDEAAAREALKITRNHQTNACEWLVGDRSKINQVEQNDGLPSDSPILVALLSSPHVQLSLSNPKIFIAYLSILEDYGSMSMWLNDSETSSIIGQVLRTYHEEKHIMAINQFSKKS